MGCLESKEKAKDPKADASEKKATGKPVSATSKSVSATVSDKKNATPPKWSRKVLASGADKDIFQGTFEGKNVAVCVAKSRGGGWSRIQNEIDCFNTIGDHDNIIKMYYSGFESGQLYLALEIVEPIGWDLDRLKNHYSFAGQTVPSSLMARIFLQLVSALGHMHSKGLIHRDLKTENVLMDGKHNAKLIDMGIACKVGTKDKLAAAYLAPELCEGTVPLDAKVDSWGLGMILHQIYQNQWKVLHAHVSPVRFLPGKPSTRRPMEKPVKDAMSGLLKIEPAKRFSLGKLKESEWLQAKTEVRADWQTPSMDAVSSDERRYLKPFRSNKPMPTALAVCINMKSHGHLIGKPISELGFASGLGITVLLINYGGNNFERLPCADTPIQEGSWLYFGVPQDSEEQMAQAVMGLEQILSPDGEMQTRGKSGAGDFRAMSKQEVTDSGKLVEFTVEFDYFSFPAHIGTEAIVGAISKKSNLQGWGESKTRALNLRKIFKINLVGILREGEDHPEWFPTASAVVRPEDLGLVVRMPGNDGSTRPTLTDDDLKALMNEEQFKELLAESGPSGAAKMPKMQRSTTWNGIREDSVAIAKQADGNDTVHVWDKPVENSKLVGEIPSGSQVTVSDEHVEFVHISWHGQDNQVVEGWVEHRDVRPATVSQQGSPPAEGSSRMEVN